MALGMLKAFVETMSLLSNSVIINHNFQREMLDGVRNDLLFDYKFSYKHFFQHTNKEICQNLPHIEGWVKEARISRRCCKPSYLAARP